MADIPIRIAEFVNRSIDYGSDWAIELENEHDSADEQKSNIHRQLVYFYDRDMEHKHFVKACYLHHILDYFKETHVNLFDLELVFQKFLEYKVISEISFNNGKLISFKKEILEIFELIRKYRNELYADLEIG
ncbi:MAG: hypothetical protein GF311_13675 [Candidatus Lokiarchaeota archaeon]|nr:hypothetical protein [Candidatus Lokiarchaeota archaeon]